MMLEFSFMLRRPKSFVEFGLGIFFRWVYNENVTEHGNDQTDPRANYCVLNKMLRNVNSGKRNEQRNNGE